MFLQHPFNQHFQYKSAHVTFRNLQSTTQVADRCRVYPLGRAFSSSKDLNHMDHSQFTALVIDSSHQFYYLYRFIFHILFNHFYSFFAIIAHFVAIIRVKLLTQKLQLHLSSAHVWFFAEFEHSVHGKQVLHFSAPRIITLHYEEIVQFAIPICIVQYAVCLLLIPACSTHLLRISFQGFRHRIVDYKADVCLVDAHAE